MHRIGREKIKAILQYRAVSYITPVINSVKIIWLWYLKSWSEEESFWEFSTFFLFVCFIAPAHLLASSVKGYEGFVCPVNVSCKRQQIRVSQSCLILDNWSGTRSCLLQQVGKKCKFYSFNLFVLCKECLIYKLMKKGGLWLYTNIVVIWQSDFTIYGLVLSVVSVIIW